ncbi:MAG: hypothetical protein Q7V57_08740 [Actinomycetota bacterium]|nr:hypothetical protein [Actinomycetota bacterium]
MVDTSVHTTTTAVPTVPGTQGTPAAGNLLPPPTVGAPPVVPATSPTVPVAAVTSTPTFEPTALLSVVEQTAHTRVQGGDRFTAPWSDAALLDVTGEQTVPPAGVQPFRLTPLVVVSAIAAVLAVGAALTDVATVEITGDLVTNEHWVLNDFASNYMVGAIIAALLLAGGAALGATGRRIGSGIAGGAGLALAGMMSMVIGQVIGIFDQWEVTLLSGGGSFELTTTQEIGFWLAVLAAVLGVVAFVLSLKDSKPDGQPPVQPTVGIVGAIATLLVVFGSLIPMNGAAFADQFSNDFTPPATLLLRLLVLVLIGVGGLTGFLLNRRWGLGLAIGAISVGVWQWITAISESGDIPVGIAGGSWGADDFSPHLVTTVGVILMVLAVVAGLLVANQDNA